MPPAARRAIGDDLPQIATTLTRAFAPYASVRASLPGPHFEQRLRELYLVFGAHALRSGEVWIADDGAAAALWQRPGMDAEAGEDTVSRVAELLGDGVERYLAIAEAAAAHRPPEPHWYLDVLGTDPDRRREGLAGATMATVLERCDAERLPAVVDTSVPANLPFYATHGFSVRKEYDEPEGGSHVWVLRREPALA